MIFDQCLLEGFIESEIRQKCPFDQATGEREFLFFQHASFTGFSFIRNDRLRRLFASSSLLIAL